MMNFKRITNLNGLDQVGSSVGHFFRWLDKLPLGNRVGSFGGGQATGVTQCRGVFGHDGGCREHLSREIVHWVESRMYSTTWQKWPLAWCCRELSMYLRLCAGWIHQVLAGHLNRLISPGKLRGVHQTLLTSWTIGVWYSHQIGSLGRSSDHKSVYIV